MMVLKLTLNNERDNRKTSNYLFRAGLENLSLLYSKQRVYGKRKPHGFTWRRRKLPDRGVQTKSTALCGGLSKDPTLLQSFSTGKTFIRDTPGWGAGRTMGKAGGKSWRQSIPKPVNFKGTDLCVPSLRQQARNMWVRPSWYWAFLNPGQNLS